MSNYTPQIQLQIEQQKGDFGLEKKLKDPTNCDFKFFVGIRSNEFSVV